MAKAKKSTRPKAPKASASEQVWKNYDTRLKAWEKKKADKEASKKRKATLIAGIKKRASR